VSRISRIRLAKGTKLTTQHVNNPLVDAATALSGNVSSSQMEKPYGVFNVILPHVVLSGRHLAGSVPVPAAGGYSEVAEAGVSFPLPPLQNDFDVSGLLASTTMVPLLDEIKISWDQRDETCSVVDIDQAHPGFMDFSCTVGVKVRLTRKRMRVFNSQAPATPEQEIVAVEIPAEATASNILRLNPIVVPCGRKPLDPYSTYTVWVSAPNIGAHCLPSFAVHLRFLYPLHPRDVSTLSSPVRNIPSKHLGAHDPASVVVTVPGAGTTIEAETIDGLHTNLTNLDSALLNGLRGGYSSEGDVGPDENIIDDACYDVIALQLHGGKGPIHPDDIPNMPWVGAPPYNNEFADRRFVALTYPLVLHHVVALEDFSDSPALAVPSKKPQSAGFVTNIDVGLGTGLRGDSHGYEQLAHLDYIGTDAARAWKCIDQIKHQVDGKQSDGTYDQTLFLVPMVYPDTGPDGTSYPNANTPTGRPIYMGRSTSATSARTQIPSSVGGALHDPHGQEQFIEVRWSFQDVKAGLDNSAIYPAETVFIGSAGHWVFLYCRKHLTGER